MVESLKELNQICQKPRYKELGNWMVRHLIRDAALPVTWLLLHTPVTANQVTLVSLVVGLAGIAALSLPSALLFFAGALGLQLWYFLDHVDGQIARYRKTACLSGRFFDFVTHHVIHSVLFFGLGFYASLATGHVSYLLWGFLTSTSITLFNMVHDTKYKTFFEKLLTMKSVEIVAADSKPAGLRQLHGPFNLMRTGYSLLHKICEIHVMMNILTGCAFLQLFFGLSFDFRKYLMMFYGVTVPFLAVTKVSYLIGARKIDEEFHRIIKEPALNDLAER